MLFEESLQTFTIMISKKQVFTVHWFKVLLVSPCADVSIVFANHLFVLILVFFKDLFIYLTTVVVYLCDMLMLLMFCISHILILCTSLVMFYALIHLRTKTLWKIFFPNCDGKCFEKKFQDPSISTTQTLLGNVVSENRYFLYNLQFSVIC